MIGERNVLVTIEANTPTQGASGEPVDSWAEFSQEWAAIQPLRGRAYLAAKESQSEETMRVALRFRDDLTDQMRVTWGGHTLRIISVQPDYTRKRETVLMCAE